MKLRILISILLFSSLAACGKNEVSIESPTREACAGDSILGTWLNVREYSDVMYIDASCSGYQTKCGMDFVWRRAEFGRVEFTIYSRSSNDPVCPELGIYSCKMNSTDGGFTFNSECHGVTADYMSLDK